MAGQSYSSTRRLAQAKARAYSIVSKFSGYRNREDITNLPPGVLIVGSQNVITNVSERVQIRQGYSVDGDPSTVASPVANSFDWLTRGNGERHVRVGGLTDAGNDGSLQFRYVNTDDSITWIDLATSLTSVKYNFTTFWNTTESTREMLYVDGATAIIYAWNGATAEIASKTANTITKTGTDTWLDAGFYTAGGKTVSINGTYYTYSGGVGTTTLTGVSPSPAGEPDGSVVFQAPKATANFSMTGIPSGIKNGLISTLNNQVFVGTLNSSALYISKVNDYTDYSSSTPRQSGQGAVLILDSQLVALSPQENYMYVSCGQDLWYNVNFSLQTSTVGVTYEQVNALRLKTGRRQGALSQASVSHMKNNIVVITQETTIDTLGRIETSLATPQTTNLSDPIKLDIDSYDFTDASIAYWRYYILVAVPKEGLVLLYNLATKSWESPQTLPISRFYIVDGELYGHSYSTFESYKLFTGYADRVYTGFAGYPIAAKWVFSYQNYGTRFSFKKATKMYVEGYINSNTMLTASITYELDGCQTVKLFTLDGNDSQFVCVINSPGSLGKLSLGKEKLGGNAAAGNNHPGAAQNLPPKFRWFPTFTNTDFFECSIGFSVLGVDNRMELLGFGLEESGSSEIPVQKMN